MNALETLRQLTRDVELLGGSFHVQIEHNGTKTEYKAFDTEYDVWFVSWEPFKIYEHYSHIPGVMEGAGICILD